MDEMQIIRLIVWSNGQSGSREGRSVGDSDVTELAAEVSWKLRAAAWHGTAWLVRCSAVVALRLDAERKSIAATAEAAAEAPRRRPRRRRLVATDPARRLAIFLAVARPPRPCLACISNWSTFDSSHGAYCLPPALRRRRQSLPQLQLLLPASEITPIQPAGCHLHMSHRDGEACLDALTERLIRDRPTACTLLSDDEDVSSP